MTLSGAIEILKIEKGVAELNISNGAGNKHDEDFVEAVSVVTDFVDDCVALLMRKS